MKIGIEVAVAAPLERVWHAWVSPADITQWNFASEDWCCPRAEINLEPGGQFSYRMEAKDGSMGFDFAGEFIALVPQHSIRYQIADGREVTVAFIPAGESVRVVETFEAENDNSAEQQRQGWLCILNNFKQHVERAGS